MMREYTIQELIGKMEDCLFYANRVGTSQVHISTDVARDILDVLKSFEGLMNE